TPLILSADTDEDRDVQMFDRAIEYAGGLSRDVHFRVFADQNRLVLLAAGRSKLAELAAEGEPWDLEDERERLITMALTALHVLRRDEHYLIRDGKAQIIDEFTGRILPDRTWVEGLHEMVERKEGLALSTRRGTTSRMTYQRFFRRYIRLAGMSGTVREIASEMWR